MDNETKEYLNSLYNWLYTEFYDEHRTVTPPPSPPPAYFSDVPMHIIKFVDIIEEKFDIIIEVSDDRLSFKFMENYLLYTFEKVSDGIYERGSYNSKYLDFIDIFRRWIYGAGEKLTQRTVYLILRKAIKTLEETHTIGIKEIKQ